MKYLIACFLLLQVLNAAQFDDMNGYINLIYNGKDLTKTFDGKQTAIGDDLVLYFTLCDDFGTKNMNGAVCDIDYDYYINTTTLVASAKGPAGPITAKYVETKNYPVSCMDFYNVIPNFEQVYNATAENQASWKVNYNCKDIPDAFPWMTVVVGVVIAVLMIAVGFFGYQYFKKKNVSADAEEEKKAPLVNEA